MLHSIVLSLQVATIATALAVIFGTALGAVLARTRLAWLVVLEIILSLPMVFPPSVTGYYLVLLFGRNGLLGGPLYALTGFQFTFHPAGAVLAAAVVSFPLMLLSARAAIQQVDPDLEKAAYTLGRSRWIVFWRITLPLAWRGLAAGAVLTFARALGEFGATLMMAGNQQTMPLAIYRAWMAEGTSAALGLVAAHTVLAVCILALALYVGRRYGRVPS
ncbi:MAG: molybdate ABC transporter permease subunit [Deltaproteobacteria bacterium]|nr:MAG: molybdate ABC transporter permease subunit [Deltaproteobacteria bacterium]